MCLEEIIDIKMIPEYAGTNGVIKVISSSCDIRYYANFKTFRKEIHDVDGRSFRFLDNGLLEILDKNNNVIKKYSSGFGFQSKKIMNTDVIDRLFFYDYYFVLTAKWYRCYNNCMLQFPTAIKTFLNIKTLFDGTSYCVVNDKGKYIIPPGKYAYIDGFKYGYARAYIKNNVLESDDDTGFRCGIVDMADNVILPIEYTSIEPFFFNHEVEISVWEGGFDCDGKWQSALFHYKYGILTKKMELIGSCYYGQYEDYTVEEHDISEQRSTWDTIADAFEDSEEAAAAADFEW